MTTTSDDLNPTMMFHTIAQALVLDIALGKLDAQELAQRELSNRGIGRAGQWVGFDKAAAEWEAEAITQA